MQRSATLGLITLMLVAAALSAAAWGVLARRHQWSARQAAWPTMAVFLALIVPSMIGYFIDARRYPVECSPSEECYDFIFWWAAIPIGLVLGALVFGTTMLWRRTR